MSKEAEGARRRTLGPAARQRGQTALGSQTRDLNAAVHKILVVGLIASAVLLVLGLLLVIVTGEAMPGSMLAPGAAVRAALALDGAGFLSLGLIALIATPILRVVGSIFVFAWERDWRYTLVTAVVLLVMIASILYGEG